MGSRWITVLAPTEIAQHWERMAAIDPGHTRCARAWWESQGRPSLDGLAAGAWLCNDAEQYQLARSYAAYLPSATDDRGTLTDVTV